MTKQIISIFILGAILILATNCNSPEKKITGKTLFTTYCVSCHGGKGNLGLNGEKNLQKSTLTIKERADIITNGKNNMNPFKGIITPEEIGLVAQYSQTLNQ